MIDGREVSAVFQVVDLAGAERGKRTMGTMTQQREANNINMSLMQLWRCLQAMQVARKDGKNGKEQIPFRESKLTHLLMPLLARVGLKGIAMLTCVNPQIDDYDETISILGNASHQDEVDTSFYTRIYEDPNCGAARHNCVNRMYCESRKWT